LEAGGGAARARGPGGSAGRALDPRRGGGRVPRPEAAARRGPPAAETRPQCAAVGPSAPSRRLGGYRHPGRMGSAAVGRAGPGRAGCAGVHALRAVVGGTASGRRRVEAGGARPGRASQADRPGSRSTRAAAAADFHGPRQRRGGVRRRGGHAPRRCRGGGSAAPSRRCPQRLPTPGTDGERRGRAGPGRALPCSQSGGRQPGRAHACGRGRSEARGGVAQARGPDESAGRAFVPRRCGGRLPLPATAARRGTPGLSESRRITEQGLAIRRFGQNERLGDSAIRRFGCDGNVAGPWAATTNLNPMLSAWHNSKLQAWPAKNGLAATRATFIAATRAFSSLSCTN
jgi:hypothetical protein